MTGSKGPRKRRAPWAILAARSLSVLGALAAGLCAGLASSAAAQTVGFERSESGDLILNRLPEVLDQTAIRSKINSGLTTTFSFRVTAERDEEILGGAEISLRYDLWEEAYRLRIRDGRGLNISEKLPETTLAQWWQRQHLVLVAVSQAQGQELKAKVRSGRVDLELSLTVIPYSSGELADTRRWLSRTGTTGRRQPSDAGNTSGSTRHLFDFLLGTSLAREVLFSKTWKVSVAPGESP